jgi:hypothetical protein
MLLLIHELAVMNVSVCKKSNSSSFNSALMEFSLVPALIGPNHDSLSLKLVFFELTLVNLSRVNKVILSLSMELPIKKLAFIGASLELEFSFSSFLSIDEVSPINYLFEVPEFNSFSMLHVVLPLTLVHAALVVAEHSTSMSFSILPLPLVNVIVRMCHPAHPIKQAIRCLSLIQRSVFKFNNSYSTPPSL